MEIAQLLTGSVASTVSATSTSGTQVKTSSAFSDCLNSVLDAASEAKSVRTSTAASSAYSASNTTVSSTADASQNTATSYKSKTGKQRVSSNTADDIDTAEDTFDETAEAVAALTPEELEALQRIAVLVSDGSLDPESMSELSEDELEEVVDWVLAGADGLFSPYDSIAAELQSSNNGASENLTLFGIDESYENLEQMESIYDRISQSSLNEKETAAIGDLLNISELDPVEVDKISQSILELAEEYAGTEASAAAGSDAETMSLKDMLKLVPADELAAAVEDTLAEIDPDVELPAELPETVLKSLCIEVVNVNNRMLDAAELNSKLLDGLNNNAELREQILRQLSNPDSGQELIASVADETVTTTELADTLAAAVLEDSSEGEIAELISADSAEAESTESEEDSAEATVDTEVTEYTSELLTEILTDSDSTAEKVTEEIKDTAKVSDQAQQLKSDNSPIPAAEAIVKDEVKVVETVAETEDAAEVQPEPLKDTAKDSLTGRAYNGENTAAAADSETIVSEDASDQSNSKQQSSGDSEEGLGSEEDPASILKSDYETVETDTKAEFKTVVNEAVNNTATAENPYVRYADMMENIDRLSKLMASSAEKSMKSVTMELSPPELGKMTIEVSVKDGQANAAIKVETDGAKSMLLNNVEQLKRNLESHGIKLENFEVELNKQQQDGRGGQSAFAQAQQEEQERRFRRRQSSIKASGVAGQSAEETVETGSAATSVIREDGSVDVVA